MSVRPSLATVLVTVGLSGLFASAAACGSSASSSPSAACDAGACSSGGTSSGGTSSGGTSSGGTSSGGDGGDAKPLYRPPCTGTVKDTTGGSTTSDALAFTYGADDRVSKITFTTPSSVWEVDLTYDADGMLATEQISDPTFLVHYSFVVAGGRIQQQLEEGAAEKQFTYDASNRLSHVTQKSMFDIDFTWSSDGASADGTYVGASQTNHYEFSPAGHLLHVTANASPTSKSDVTYAYDASGRLTSIVSLENGNKVGDEEFTYDANGDLVKRTSWDVAGGGTPRQSESTFEYACWAGRRAPVADGCAKGGDLGDSDKPCWYRVLGAMSFVANPPY